ncbi:MAG: VOC family protein [Flavitalea sp.]
MIKNRIVTCLWFDGQAEEAANYYVSIFKNAKVGNISRYGKEGQEIHRQTPGSAMVVAFELDGSHYTGLNGGPNFKFTEAVSLQVMCEDQKEVDYYWSRLTAGGQESQCGWCKDKFGLSWQVVPNQLGQLFSDPEKAKKIMGTFMQMKKIDIDKLLELSR